MRDEHPGAGDEVPNVIKWSTMSLWMPTEERGVYAYSFLREWAPDGCGLCNNCVALGQGDKWHRQVWCLNRLWRAANGTH